MDTKKLRQKILDLAIHGKLVPQDPNDEPASVLLERIRAEKERLIAEGKIKRSKKSCANRERSQARLNSAEMQPRLAEGKSATSDTSHYENEPFEVPEGWCWCHIDDLCYTIFAGGDKPSIFSATKTSECNIPIYANAIQHEGLYGYTDKAVVEMPAITVSARGTIGFVCVRKTPFVPIVRLITLVPIYSCKIEYIAYALQYFVSPAEGSSIPQLTVPTFRSTLIPIPPLEEQKRIVEQMKTIHSFIDSVDENKQDLNSEIKQTKTKILDLAIHGKLVPQDANDEPAHELLKRINPKAIASCDNPHYEQIGFEMPSNWLISSLSDICDSINGLWTGKKPPFVRVGVIRNANFTKDFRLDYSKIEYIEVEEKSFEKRHLLNGDIIVEKSGGSDKNPVGRAILYEGVDKQFSYSNFTMVLRIRNHSCVYSKYLYYYLMAVYLRGDMRKLQTQTTGLHNLILDSYLSMPIYLPPFEEQKRISNKIDELFKSLEAIANTLR